MLDTVFIHSFLIWVLFLLIVLHVHLVLLFFSTLLEPQLMDWDVFPKEKPHIIWRLLTTKVQKNQTMWISLFSVSNLCKISEIEYSIKMSFSWYLCLPLLSRKRSMQSDLVYIKRKDRNLDYFLMEILNSSEQKAHKKT